VDPSTDARYGDGTEICTATAPRSARRRLLRRLDDRGTGADRQRALFTSGISTPAFITALARATLSGYEPGRWRRPGAWVPAAAGAQ